MSHVVVAPDKFARAYALTDIEPDVTRCREEAGPLLEDLAERVARDWLVS